MLIPSQFNRRAQGSALSSFRSIASGSVGWAVQNPFARRPLRSSCSAASLDRVFLTPNQGRTLNNMVQPEVIGRRSLGLLSNNTTCFAQVSPPCVTGAHGKTSLTSDLDHCRVALKREVNIVHPAYDRRMCA